MSDVGAKNTTTQQLLSSPKTGNITESISFRLCAGNLLVILAVRTTRKLQIVSNAFVVNLSVCDLLFVTVILPFNIYTYLTDGWDLPEALCKLIGFLGYTLTGSVSFSPLSLTVLSCFTGLFKLLGSSAKRSTAPKEI